MVSVAAKRNVVRVQMGIESGSLEMRRRYGKHLSNDSIIEAVKILNDAEIPSIIGSFILGGPCENEKTIDETLNLIELLIDAAPGKFEPMFSFLRPYPGTKVYEQFQHEFKDIPGIRIGNTIEDRPILETQYLNESELFACKNYLLLKIREKMISSFSKVDLSSLKKLYKLETKFQFQTPWTSLFKESPNCKFFLESTDSDFIFDQYKNFYEIYDLRPYCTVQLSIDINKKQYKLPYIRNSVIQVSLEHAYLLSLCNGERSVKQVVADYNLRCLNSEIKNKEQAFIFLSEMTKGLLVSWRLP